MRRARYVIVAVCVLAAIIAIPEFFEKNVISGKTLVTTEFNNMTLGEYQDVIGNLSFDKNSKTLIGPPTGTSKLRFHKNRHRRQFPAHLNYRLESESETTVKEIKHNSKTLPKASPFSFSNFPLKSSLLSPSPPPPSSSSPPFRVCLEESKTLKAVRTDFGNSALYNLAYLYTNQVLFTFLPLILLMIFNLLLLRQVITASRERRKLAPCQISAFAKGDVCSANHSQSAPEMIECLNTSLQLEGVVPVQRVTVRASGGLRSSQQSKDQQRITIMLITLVIVFILCQLPQSLQNVYRVYR